eukprot:1490888-Pleurochrysis_carterae.AAC.3
MITQACLAPIVELPAPVDRHVISAAALLRLRRRLILRPAILAPKVASLLIVMDRAHLRVARGVRLVQ